MASVRFEKRGQVAWVTLDRPQVHNAIDLAMRDELWEVVGLLADDPECRAAVFCGAGQEAFSSGADLNDFGAAPSYVQAREARLQRDLWGALLRLDKPLLAAIQGYALGAGLELALCCDIRIAADNALLGLPEGSLGYIPAAGGTQLLPRTVGRAAAARMLFSGEPVGAEEALRIGLVHKVVPAASLRGEAMGLAERLAHLDTYTVAAAKRALQAALDLPLEQGLALETVLAARLLIGGGR